VSGERILLVEDDPAVSEGIAYALSAEGYIVTSAADGIEAVNAVKERQPDLIILDLMLPKLSGIDVCRFIRRDSSVPIIILTAKTAETDRVIGLEVGADDYVTKPFSTRELIARIRAVLRRVQMASESTPPAVVQAEGICLDILRRTASVHGRTINLTPKEFELLRCLVSNPNRVMERRVLFDRVWGEDSGVGERTLDVHIRWLRQKVELDPSNPKLILTVRGIGYRFASG
jgi:DNA-binding response OmpR family regulator